MVRVPIRRFSLFAGVLACGLLSQSAVRKESLDLPFDAAGVGGEEEEAPEVIVLFGTAYASDGFVFVGGGTT